MTHLDELVKHCEDSYVRILNGLLTTQPEGFAEYLAAEHQLGEMQAYLHVVKESYRVRGLLPPNLQSKAWRDAHGVYSETQVEEMRLKRLNGIEDEDENEVER